MIKKTIIGLILLVCICSGAFSVMSYYNPTNNSDMDNTDSNSIIGNTKENIKSIEKNPLTNYIDYIDDIFQYSYGYLLNDDNELIVFINHEMRHYLSNNSYYIESFYGLDYEYSHGYIRIIDGELRHYVNNNGGYYLESDGILDTYTQCIECKGYIPLGNITKPIPSYLICHHDRSTGRIIPEDLKEFKNLYTYDDLISELGSDNYIPYEDAHLKFIRCDECGGFVDITQSNEIIEDYLCHHYNGTLNKSEIPKDKMLCYDEVYTILSEEGNIVWFWEGYNHWLEEANNSLNENNAHIDDTVAPIDNNDFTPDNTVEDLLNSTE